MEGSILILLGVTVVMGMAVIAALLLRSGPPSKVDEHRSASYARIREVRQALVEETGEVWDGTTRGNPPPPDPH